MPETKTEVRRFTEVDWYGFAGCTRFADGSEPFLFETQLRDSQSGLLLDVQVIGDGEQIGVYGIEETTPEHPWDDECDWVDHCWSLSHNGKWNSTTVETFLNGLRHSDILFSKTLLDMGFEKC